MTTTQVDEGMVRVMLIEDDEDDRYLFKQCLEEGNLKAELVEFGRAEDVVETLGDLVEHPFDVIVTDHSLPGMNGLELCKQLVRANVASPLVLLTGHGSEDLAVAAMKAGVDDYLVKSHEAQFGEKLVHVLRDVVRRHEDRRARAIAEKATHRREAILEAVGFAAHSFLRDIPWDKNLAKVLARFGMAAEMSWVYLYKRVTSKDGLDSVVQYGEWLSASHGPDDDCAYLRTVPWASGDFDWIEAQLRTGQVIHCSPSGLKEREREIIQARGVESLVLVPVRTDNAWWGFIELDDCVRRRQWTHAELSAFQAAADILGAALCRNQVEQDLRESEERLKFAMTASSDGLWDWGVRDNTMYFSPSWYTQLGYEPDEFAASYGAWRELLHPDDRESTEKIVLAHSNRGRGLFEVEYRTMTKQGEWRWMLGRGMVVEEDEDGQPIRMTGTNTDITERKQLLESLERSRENLEQRVKQRTEDLAKINQSLRKEIAERKQAEDALRESREFLQAVMNSLSAQVVVLDSQGEIVMYNQAWSQFARHVGLQKGSSCLGVNYLDACEHSDPKGGASARQAAQGIREVIGGKRDSLYMEYACVATGELRWFQLRVSKLSYHDREWVIAAFENITECKRVEEELRLSEQRFQTVADFTYNWEYWLGHDSEYIYISPSCEQFTGYCREDFIGDPGLLIELIHPEDRDHFVKHRHVEHDTEESSSCIFRLFRRDGELRWINHACRPVYSREGEFLGRRASNSDITERKLAEEALAEERANLEKTVALRTQQLRQSLNELQEANRHKGHFLSCMSHELRTPLNAVLGFSDLLGEQVFGELNDKQKEYVDLIQCSGNHLLELINDLLDLAKIDNGALELEMEELSVSELIDSAMTMISSDAAKKSVALQTQIPEDLPAIRADRRRFIQILLNLLTNAVKFTNTDGLIEVRARREGPLLRVEVVDDGIGILPEDQERIFSEFEQADRTRDTALGGSGIGLAVCKRLVELHGGLIGVESGIGEGSTFWFHIPASGIASEVNSGGEAPSTTVEAPRGLRVLVAEDNEINLQMVLDMLQLHDHEVVVAKNGREAVEMAEKIDPELILMDIRMPEMDGFEATRRIRQLAHCRTVPIIAVSASADKDAVAKCIDAGCTAHLAKPLHARQLFGAITRVVLENAEA